MRKFIHDAWNGIMNSSVNPLKNIPDQNVRHMIMQVLAFMWSGVFSLYIVNSIFVFGITSKSCIMSDETRQIIQQRLGYKDKYNRWDIIEFFENRCNKDEICIISSCQTFSEGVDTKNANSISPYDSSLKVGL